jgi:hypothetical protein
MDSAWVFDERAGLCFLVAACNLPILPAYAGMTKGGCNKVLTLPAARQG